MENVIYKGRVKPAQDSPDGETTHRIIVTREANGFAVWESSFHAATDKPKEWYWDRDLAIEDAVALTLRRKAESKKDGP